MPLYRIIYETESTTEGQQLSTDITTDEPLYSKEFGTWHNDRVQEALRSIGQEHGHEKVALVRVMEAQDKENDVEVSE